MIRAVLIDLDDTLVDHQHALRTALRALHESDSRLSSFDFEYLVGEWQRLLESMHEEVALGRIPVHEARMTRYRHFYALCGNAVDPDEAGHIAERHLETYRASRRTVPGAVELMELIRRHAQVAVITNNTVREQEEKLATFGLRRHIDELVTSEECGVAKPGAAIFRLAIERLGVGVEECVMVGDSWTNDVVGATRIGMRAVWLNRHAATCPDKGLATEIGSLEPAAQVAELLLNRPLESRAGLRPTNAGDGPALPAARRAR